MANRLPLRPSALSRRSLLNLLAAAGGTLALGAAVPGLATAQETSAMPSFTGPGANPYWNSVGPYVFEPQKAPLLLLTDRGVQLETPRSYFQTAFTPNHAFYVRWHLEGIPNAVDLKSWRLHIEGNVAKPVSYSLADLIRKFPAESIAAVNQCSGNSRSRLEPRVAGGQWGNGAMGNARWTGVRLRELFTPPPRRPVPCRCSFRGLRAVWGRKVTAPTYSRSRWTWPTLFSRNALSPTR